MFFVNTRWWFVVAVTVLGVSTKLLYVEPGEYWDGCMTVCEPAYYLRSDLGV